MFDIDLSHFLLYVQASGLSREYELMYGQTYKWIAPKREGNLD